MYVYFFYFSTQFRNCASLRLATTILKFGGTGIHTGIGMDSLDSLLPSLVTTHVYVRTPAVPGTTQYRTVQYRG